jgi:hypothetical protein
MARTLSTQQIAQGLRNAGFAEDVIPTMTAVTMAESGGNPYAHNPNAGTGDNSYGLLQINMLGGMGPERRKWFGLNNDDQLFDPATNFKAAKQIYDTQGIGAWGAYTNGSYKKYLGQDSAGGALVQAGDAGPNASVDTSGGALNNTPGLPEIRTGSQQKRMGTAAIEANDQLAAQLLGTSSSPQRGRSRRQLMAPRRRLSPATPAPVLGRTWTSVFGTRPRVAMCLTLTTTPIW